MNPKAETRIHTDDGESRDEGKGRIGGRRGRTEKKEGRDWEIGRKDGCFGRRRKTSIGTEVKEDGRKKGRKGGSSTQVRKNERWMK